MRQLIADSARLAGFMACMVAWACLSGCGPASPPEETSEFAKAMNRGKAHLENRDAVLAIEAFERAIEHAPDSAPALRNLARAYLLARDVEPLEEVLGKARALERESAATSYLTGLSLARQSRFEQAIPEFEHAVQLDPHTATLRYQLARAYQAAGRHEEAIEQLHETLRLDPFNSAAHYRLAGYARQAGDMEELERRLRELERLRGLFGDQNGSVEFFESCVYTLAEPPPAVSASADRKADSLRDEVRFRDATGEMLRAEPGITAPVVAASVLDVDDRGRYTLFAAGADRRASLLTAAANGVLRRSAVDLTLSEAVLASDRLVSLVADFRGNGPDESSAHPASQLRNGLLLLGDGGAQLFARKGPRTFEDITADAGLSGVKGNAARWVDYDQDGDIDLLVGGETGLEMWENGGDVRFENVTRSAGIDETGPVRDVAAVDLDDDVAVDLVAARGARPTRVFENQRTGQFAPQPEPPGPWPAAHRVLVDDLDNDGHLDAVLVGEGEALFIPGRGGARHRFDLGEMEPRAAALIDFDNDGWLDLFVAGGEPDRTKKGRLALWRNAGADGWLDYSTSTGIASVAVPTPNHVLSADLDTDGDSDLLLVTADGLRMLRNEGGDAGGQLKIRLVGTKSNPSGIGTRVEVRAGEFWAVRSISFLPVEIGLGGRRRLDSVRTVWTNGVVENQIQVAVSREPLTIVERVVDTGSCPFLYAWDGNRFRFVTDLLGISPLGMSVRRGEVVPSDSEELAWIGDSSSLVPRAGHYVLQVTDELREVLYLDEVRLVAVDHAPGVEVHPTDQLRPAPFPPSELWPMRSPRVPRAAVGDDGVERTRAVSAVDGDFAPPGRPLSRPLRGKTHPLVLTLDFGPLDDVHAPVLALTGWIQYRDASTNIAISQNASLPVVPTTLDMETADGAWKPVDVTVGMPAGKTKTVLVDLAGRLEPGVRRLRLRTSYELHWDRIALLERLPASAAEIHMIRPVTAELRWRGFSEIRPGGPHHPTTPDWDVVFDRPPWRTRPEGWMTRYGDVHPLVTGRDGELAILSGGDALELRFTASDLPPLPSGRTRTFFFYSVGWDKEGSYNVVNGDTVEPLPVIAEAGDDWRVRYNTRWVSGDWPAREQRRRSTMSPSRE
jgi:tetratricopeptide (TPR) repeat protein